MAGWAARLNLQRVFAKAGVTLADREFLAATRDLEREVGQVVLKRMSLERLEGFVAAYVGKWAAHPKKRKGIYV